MKTGGLHSRHEAPCLVETATVAATPCHCPGARAFGLASVSTTPFAPLRACHPPQNPGAAQGFLSPDQYIAGQNSTSVFNMHYGNAFHNMVADQLQGSPYNQFFTWQHQPGVHAPDIGGIAGSPAEGLIWDVTTPGQIPDHMQNYGPSLIPLPYQRPPGVSRFP